MSDIISVITQLTTYETVLKAELKQINLDLEELFILSRKYDSETKGKNPFLKSQFHLSKLQRDHISYLKEIELQLELFRLHMRTGRTLISKLNIECPRGIKLDSIPQQIERTSNDRFQPNKSVGGNAIGVVSPILANADQLLL